MSIFNEFFKKEKPVFTGLKFGFGSGGGVAGDASPLAATGGTVATPGNGYVYHFFTSDTPSPTRKLVNNVTRNVDYLIIGGGAAGGNGPNTGDYQAAGGGGAGAFYTGTSSNLATGTFPVTIGSGGAAGSGSFPGSAGRHGNNGGTSTWNSINSPGGGSGGGGTNNAGPPDYRAGVPSGGGSGGNGGYGPSGLNQVPSTAAQYPGSGDSFASPPVGWGGKGNGSYGSCGGGGGGASNVATRNPPVGAGPGPAPYSRISGQDGLAAFNGDTGVPSDYGTPGPGPGRYFAAGGGGGHDQTSPGIIPGASGGVGGFGGGGDGGSGGERDPAPVPVQNARKGTDATAHTGSGGGGCGRDFYPGNYSNGHGGAGADGIVILRYLA